MRDAFLSEQNLKFLLYDVFDAESLLQYPYYADHSREAFDMVSDTAMKIGVNLLRPVLGEMDKKPPELQDGKVIVHPVVKDLMKEYGDGGWISAIAPTEIGGQQLPRVVNLIPNFIFAAANYSASAYLILTAEAAHLIESFGTAEMKETYIPKMYAGEWQGTMALTEPQAGTSLADIATTAEPAGNGTYKIKGQKIFISASEHNGVANVVNLLLARIKGAPAGVKGISLFVVPNKRIGADGTLFPNDVNVAGTYHKLGYKGCPINQLSFGEEDDCCGQLVGEPNKGLSYMFQMMNAARLLIGVGATAIASAAYYASLEYAKERCQGRSMTEKNPAAPQVPIIEHADVKRMLLFQRSIVEGSLSLLFQCYKYSDLDLVLTGAAKEKNALLLDLLTPIAKSYPSEMGILSVSQGLQILGGYGYCDEFPLEQFYRDVRIHPIHEGTTGIHGITLLGRNVTMNSGQAFKLYVEELQGVIKEAKMVTGLESYALELEAALEKLQRVTASLLLTSQEKGREVFLADATLYLEFFGIIAIAWQWLLQAISVQKILKNKEGLSESDANFYQGKMHALRFFFVYELPKIDGLGKRLLATDGFTVEAKAETF